MSSGSSTPAFFTFISYRRRDAESLQVSEVYQSLESTLGQGAFFLDTARLRPAREWRRQVDAALAKHTHLVLLAGPNFTRGSLGREDEVVRELRQAHKRAAPILPVAVGIKPPTVLAELPSDLQHLDRLHWHELPFEARRSTPSAIAECVAKSLAEPVVTAPERLALHELDQLPVPLRRAALVSLPYPSSHLTEGLRQRAASLALLNKEFESCRSYAEIRHEQADSGLTRRAALHYLALLNDNPDRQAQLTILGSLLHRMTKQAAHKRAEAMPFGYIVAAALWRRCVEQPGTGLPERVASLRNLANDSGQLFEKAARHLRSQRGKLLGPEDVSLLYTKGLLPRCDAGGALIELDPARWPQQRRRRASPRRTARRPQRQPRP